MHAEEIAEEIAECLPPGTPVIDIKGDKPAKRPPPEKKLTKRQEQKAEAKLENIVLRLTTAEDHEGIMKVLREAREAYKTTKDGSYEPDWAARLAAVKLQLSYLCAPLAAVQQVNITATTRHLSVAEQIDLLKRANCDVESIIDKWSGADKAHLLADAADVANVDSENV